MWCVGVLDAVCEGVGCGVWRCWFLCMGVLDVVCGGAGYGVWRCWMWCMGVLDVVCDGMCLLSRVLCVGVDG